MKNYYETIKKTAQIGWLQNWIRKNYHLNFIGNWLVHLALGSHGEKNEYCRRVCGSIMTVMY